MNHVFISYANEDREHAQRLAELREEKGWPVWWDRHIVTGQVYYGKITEALDTAKCVVALWSRASIGSDWVNDEATEGKIWGVLLPALIEDVQRYLHLQFRHVQMANLIGWTGDRSERDAAFAQYANS
jgi:TIR domain-containing protein